MSLNIAIVMPRNMAFGPQGATAIDLCVHDIATHLPADATVTVYAEDNVQPFTDVAVKLFPRTGWLQKKLYLRNIANALRAAKHDVVVVQQHLASAATLARALPGLPIILHAHNFQSPGKARLKRSIQSARYARLAGMMLVSQACFDHYRQHWPEAPVTAHVLPNGVDLAVWQPQAVRNKNILFVGRLTPDKGVLPLAQALAQVLPHHPTWQADFIFGDADKFPTYAQLVENALQPIAKQVTVKKHQPWDAVKAAYENAGIAVVPSAYQEAFGRTALEAMAGGAALISSTNGGLGEVVDEAAYRLPSITADAIAEGLRKLITNDVYREGLAAKGRARAGEFSLDAMGTKFVEICRAHMVS